jgi:hypothetical protein
MLNNEIQNNEMWNAEILTKILHVFGWLTVPYIMVELLIYKGIKNNSTNEEIKAVNNSIKSNEEIIVVNNWVEPDINEFSGQDLATCFIAGVKHADSEDEIKMHHKGDLLFLKHTPTIAYPNAVSIFSPCGTRLGYVPEKYELSKRVADHILSGNPIKATIRSIHKPSEEFDFYNAEITITRYFPRTESEFTEEEQIMISTIQDMIGDSESSFLKEPDMRSNGVVFMGYRLNGHRFLSFKWGKKVKYLIIGTSGERININGVSDIMQHKDAIIKAYKDMRKYLKATKNCYSLQTQKHLSEIL